MSGASLFDLHGFTLLKHFYGGFYAPEVHAGGQVSGFHFVSAGYEGRLVHLPPCGFKENFNDIEDLLPMQWADINKPVEGDG
jgi:hypothetical protein